MNLANMVAKCPSCNSLMDLNQYLSNDGSRVPSSKPTKVSQLPVPVGWAVSHEGGGLEISWRWFNYTLIFMALFCVAWDSFLVFWYTMAFRHGQLIMVIFPLAHVAVGVGLTYTTIAGFFNKTKVKVSGRELTVRSGPIPWLGNRSLNVNELADFAVESPSSGSYSRFVSTNRSLPTFKVNAISTDGRSLPLVGRVPSNDQALFLVQSLKNQLALK
jgi:hypothetical protein